MEEAVVRGIAFAMFVSWLLAVDSAANWRKKAEAAEERAVAAEAWSATVEQEAALWVAEAGR